jgi:hypothetical protein
MCLRWFKLRHYCRPICCVILEIILECKREFKELECVLLVELIPAGQFVQNSKRLFIWFKAGINGNWSLQLTYDLNQIYVLSVSIEDSKMGTTLLWNHGVKEIKIKVIVWTLVMLLI